MVLHTPHNILLPPISGRAGRVLAALINSRRIPQALLLSGIDGIGKSAAATQLALTVNCENRPQIQPDPETMDRWCCGKCPTCRKISSCNHPDILTISPKKDQIRIDTIRTLITQLGFTPYSASYRFVLIRRAEKMTVAASNALLKILEEPPALTHFILTTANVSGLLPTILSRCQIIRFQPWPDDVIISHLMAEHHLDQPTAAKTAKMAAGSPLKAVELAQKDWINTHKGIMSALDEADRLTIRERLVLAHRLAQKKSDLETLLLWLKTVILEKVKTQSAAIINNQTSSHGRTPVKQLVHRYEIIEDALFLLSTNVNRRMVLENMLLSFTADLAPSTTEEL